MKNKTKSSKGSIRYNKGKPEMSQLSPEFLLDLADVMTQGEGKYPKYNWTKGSNYSTAFDSCMRHLLKFQNGENMDDETGKSHILHAACNLMFLYHSFKHHKDLDDRPKEEE